MKLPALICAPIFAAALAGCGEKAEVTVTETRPLSTRDGAPRLFATADERFSNARPSPVVAGALPAGWVSLPGDEFRLLNYRFGPSGTGEVWVATSAGSVADNVNRWLRQFGAPPLDAAGLAQLPKVPLLGGEAVRVKAEGSYTPGMGQEARSGQALDGAIMEYQGQILTVKMVGSADEVRVAAPALEMYLQGLRPAG